VRDLGHVLCYQRTEVFGGIGITIDASLRDGSRDYFPIGRVHVILALVERHVLVGDVDSAVVRVIQSA